MHALINKNTYEARITEKGDSGFYRLTIPAEIRKILKVDHGDKVRIGTKDNKIIIIKSKNGLGIVVNKDGNINLPIRLSERYKINTGDTACFYKDNSMIVIKL